MKPAAALPVLVLWWLCAQPQPALDRTAELARAGSVIHLPGLAIHGGDQPRVEATGRVCLNDGILEFIAVEPTGRDYESVFTLDCKPSALQFALLLIGCEPGTSPHLARPGEKPGSLLAIEVEWHADGKPKRVPVEKFLVDRRTQKVPQPLPWVFTGSQFVTDPVTEREVFVADAEQAFIALLWQPGIVVNLGADYGNPYRGRDQGFEVNRRLVPPVGTPVKLILRKREN